MEKKDILNSFLISKSHKKNFQEYLDKLHNYVKDQLPKTKNGLIDAYKDIIPTLIKQKQDPSYCLPVALPDS